MNTARQQRCGSRVTQAEMWTLSGSAKHLVAGMAAASRAALLVTALVILALSASPARAASEQEVKAAFIYNFAQFVDWPSKAFESSSSSLVIGVLGSDSVAGALDQAVKNKTVNGRKLIVKRASRVRDLSGCQIVFIGRTEKARAGDVIDAVKGSNVLTIGETEGFARRGGIINFTMQDQKVRFEINVNAARQNGLQVSSKLLRLATIIGGA